MKGLLKALVVIIVLIAVGSVAYLYFYGTGMIRDGVETYGPRVTGTPVALGGVSLQPLNGAGSLSGFAVGNPQGFSDANLFSVDAIDIKLQPKSLFSDVIVIDKLLIDAPHIAFEQKGSSTNLQALQRNIQKFVDENIGASDQSAEAKKVIIRDLILRAPVVQIAVPGLGVSNQSIELADMHLRNIGGGQNGVTPARAGQIVMDAVLPQVQRALASQQGKKLLKQVLGDKIDLDKSLGDQAKKALGKELDKGLNNLLKGEDK